VKGCCGRCEGTGHSGWADPDSGGLCSDCQATGCAHPPPLCADGMQALVDHLQATVIKDRIAALLTPPNLPDPGELTDDDVRTILRDAPYDQENP
jgi:hypothetical protein